MENLETVNKRLLDNYGKGLQDLPRYRIVWAASEKETRTGRFVKHTEAGIYLGEAVLTTEVEKYPQWEGYWILEYIQPNHSNPELKAAYSYEPIWIFKDGYDNPLPFDWEITEKIIYFHIHGMAKPAPTQRELDNAEEEKLEKEKAATLDYLQHDEPFPNKMYDSKVVTVPSKYERH